MPVGGTITHFIDVGAEDTQGNARITGPFDRISDKREINGTRLREIQKELVYFELQESRLQDSDEIEVRIRFKDNFPAGTSLSVGARNKEEWSYYWQEIFVSDSKWQAGHKNLLQADGSTGWLIAQATWRSEDVFIDNSRLSFCFKTSHLKKKPDNVIPVDWIEITVRVPPIRVERGRNEQSTTRLD